jgi:hypothetical protein
MISRAFLRKDDEGKWYYQIASDVSDSYINEILPRSVNRKKVKTN